MQSIGHIFADEKLHNNISLRELVVIGNLMKKWADVVAGKLSENCLPIAIQKNILHVAVQSPVWLQEAQLQSATILENVRKQLPALTSVKFSLRRSK